MDENKRVSDSFELSRQMFRTTLASAESKLAKFGIDLAIEEFEEWLQGRRSGTSSDLLGLSTEDLPVSILFEPTTVTFSGNTLQTSVQATMASSSRTRSSRPNPYDAPSFNRCRNLRALMDRTTTGRKRSAPVKKENTVDWSDIELTETSSDEEEATPKEKKRKINTTGSYTIPRNYSSIGQNSAKSLVVVFMKTNATSAYIMPRTSLSNRQKDTKSLVGSYIMSPTSSRNRQKDAKSLVIVFRFELKKLREAVDAGKDISRTELDQDLLNKEQIRSLVIALKAKLRPDDFAADDDMNSLDEKQLRDTAHALSRNFHLEKPKEITKDWRGTDLYSLDKEKLRSLVWALNGKLYLGELGADLDVNSLGEIELRCVARAFQFEVEFQIKQTKAVKVKEAKGKEVVRPGAEDQDRHLQLSYPQDEFRSKYVYDDPDEHRHRLQARALKNKAVQEKLKASRAKKAKDKVIRPGQEDRNGHLGFVYSTQGTFDLEDESVTDVEAANQEPGLNFARTSKSTESNKPEGQVVRQAIRGVEVNDDLTYIGDYEPGRQKAKFSKGSRSNSVSFTKPQDAIEKMRAIRMQMSGMKYFDGSTPRDGPGGSEGADQESFPSQEYSAQSTVAGSGEASASLTRGDIAGQVEGNTGRVEDTMTLANKKLNSMLLAARKAADHARELAKEMDAIYQPNDNVTGKSVIDEFVREDWRDLLEARRKTAKNVWKTTLERSGLNPTANQASSSSTVDDSIKLVEENTAIDETSAGNDKN